MQTVYGVDKQQDPAVQYRELYSVSCDKPYWKRRIKIDTNNIYWCNNLNIIKVFRVRLIVFWEREVSYNIPCMWNLKRNDTSEVSIKQKQTHKLREQAYSCCGEGWGKG